MTAEEIADQFAGIIDRAELVKLITQALRAAHDAGVKEGLEKAAEVCDNIYENTGWHPFYKLAASYCTNEIRSLIKS